MIEIASLKNGNIYFEIPFLNISKHQEIKPGNTTIELDNLLIQNATTFLEQKGIYLRSTVNIAVFVTSYKSGSQCTYVAFPIAVLGKCYHIASFSPQMGDSSFDGSVLMVIGVHNSTRLSVTFPNDTFIAETINRLDCFQKYQREDLTGTLIKSNKPVAVISGASCATFNYYCDMIISQLLPQNHWDSYFIVPSFQPLQSQLIRIASAGNDTGVQIKYSDTALKYFEVPADNILSQSVISDLPFAVLSTNAIQVVLYAGSEDASFAVIPGMSQYLYEYYFIVSVLYSHFENFIAIIIKSDEENGLSLDGNILKDFVTTDTVTVLYNKYTVLTYRLSTGFHHIIHRDNATFGLICFGNNGNENVLFPVGFYIQNSK